jgi:hypothetical protein
MGGAIITRAHLRRGLRMRRALALAGVADDQVIDQRHVEDAGRLRQPERESRIVRARCRIAARVVEYDINTLRARQQR